MQRATLSIDLRPTSAEAARLDRHGYVNLINVVHAELQLIERMVDAPGALRDSIRLAEAASRAFREKRVAERYLTELSRFAATIDASVTALLDRSQYSTSNDVVEAVAILASVLDDADLRVQETIARHGLARPVDGAAPVGMADAVDRLVAALAQTFGADASRYKVVQSVPAAPDSQTITLAVSGPGTHEPFAPLMAHPTPSEVLGLVKDGATLLRDAARLCYFAVPSGDVVLGWADSTIEVVARTESVPAVEERAGAERGR
ncbi:MAG: hypothetical protein EA382_07640 [Spirochaetaceae bacterium]|nr:MAG: hypothetical protein EA382_07640 [Spirochaetaceae bacterium]